jgi:hypothetical protein
LVKGGSGAVGETRLGGRPGPTAGDEVAEL